MSEIKQQSARCYPELVPPGIDFVEVPGGVFQMG